MGPGWGSSSRWSLVVGRLSMAVGCSSPSLRSSVTDSHFELLVDTRNIAEEGEVWSNQSIAASSCFFSSIIAEGKGRSSHNGACTFLAPCQGDHSLKSRPKLLIAERLRYVNETETRRLLRLVEALAKTLNALIKSLNPMAA